MTRYIAYYRVSTQKQGQSGLGLEAQQASVSNFIPKPDALIHSYTEVESGTRSDRPQLALALDHARREKATLLIAKLDRLARSNAFVANLLESGVEIKACDMPDANKPMLQMMSVFAEMEAKAISDRTKAALAAAKARGVQLGKHARVLNRERQRQADAHAQRLASTIAEIRTDGSPNVSEIARQLNERGIPTARGGQWQCVQVQRLLARL